MKKKISVIITIILCFSLISVPNVFSRVYAKNQKPALNKKKIEIKVGKTKTIKLKNAPKKVKWKVTNKKVVKIVKKSGRKNNKIKIKGLKAGKTKITARCNNKKYVIRVTVKKKTDEKNNANKTVTEVTTTKLTEVIVPEQTTSKTDTPKEPESETSTVNQNPYRNKNVVATVKNNAITVEEELILTFKLQNFETGQAMCWGYAPTKFEKFENEEWKSVPIKAAFPEPLLISTEEEAEFKIFIGDYYELSIGHYRWTHEVNGTEISVEFDIVE